MMGIEIASTRSGTAGNVTDYSTLSALFAASSPSDGDRAALTTGGKTYGIWRYSTTAGNLWMPDGYVDLTGGTDAIFGAGVDGNPSGNSGSGSVSYSWGVGGITVSGTDSTDQNAFWEWELLSSDIDFDNIRGWSFDSFFTFSTAGPVLYMGQYAGEVEDFGADRPAVRANYGSDNKLQVVYAGSNNSAGITTQGTTIRLFTKYARGKSSNCDTTIYAVEAAATYQEFAFPSTWANANHEAGDTFSRCGLAQVVATSGTGAWSVTFSGFKFTLDEK